MSQAEKMRPSSSAPGKRQPEGVEPGRMNQPKQFDGDGDHGRNQRDARP